MLKVLRCGSIQISGKNLRPSEADIRDCRPGLPRLRLGGGFKSLGQTCFKLDPFPPRFRGG